MVSFFDTPASPAPIAQVKPTPLSPRSANVGSSPVSSFSTKSSFHYNSPPQFNFSFQPTAHATSLFTWPSMSSKLPLSPPTTPPSRVAKQPDDRPQRSTHPRYQKRAARASASHQPEPFSQCAMMTKATGSHIRAADPSTHQPSALTAHTNTSQNRDTQRQHQQRRFLSAVKDRSDETRWNVRSDQILQADQRAHQRQWEEDLERAAPDAEAPGSDDVDSGADVWAESCEAEVMVLGSSQQRRDELEARVRAVEEMERAELDALVEMMDAQDAGANEDGERASAAWSAEDWEDVFGDDVWYSAVDRGGLQDQQTEPHQQPPPQQDYDDIDMAEG